MRTLLNQKEVATSARKTKPDPEEVIARLWNRPGFLVRRCMQDSTAVFEQACGALGITARQYDYLFVLNEMPRVGQTDIAEMLGLDWSTNTLVLKIMERKGWIVRETAESDSRRREIMLTPEGRKAYRRAEAAARTTHAAMWDVLSAEELNLLRHALSKVIVQAELFLGGRVSMRPRRPGSRRAAPEST
jgi:MarR family transcriptional regulator, lower aerobic nicotinate degradation pathway regulator